MKKLLIIGSGLLVLALGIASTQVCLRAALRYGLWLDECPDGELRQTVAANGNFQRGAPSSIYVTAYAHYTYGASDLRASTPLRSFSASIRLAGNGADQALAPKEWTRSGDSLFAELQLPKLNDGDYTLKVKAHSPLGESTVDLPLPLYAPARVHLIT